MDTKDVLRARFTAYMGKVLYHSRIDYIRKKQRLEAFEILTQDALRMAYMQGKNVEEKGDKPSVLMEGAGLSRTERLVIQKFYRGEVGMRKIAQELGLSVQGVYAIKNRALKKLKRAFTEEE